MIAALLCAAVLTSSSGEAPLWSAQPAQVGEIAFEGAPAESVRSLVAVQVGAALDARDVRDSVRALHGSARFSKFSLDGLTGPRPTQSRSPRATYRWPADRAAR